MPPRTRAAKSTKGLKENVGVVIKAKQKGVGKITKPARKVLGDKTNSASDDNTSVEVVKKTAKNSCSNVKNVRADQENNNTVRPRRDRRLPGRFAGNLLLNNLSNKSNESTPNVTLPNNNTSQTPAKSDSILQSPFKTPQKIADNSLVANRPRRICRLPSKFEDHSISPNKFIPVQPFYASTPIVQNSTETSDQKRNNNASSNKSEKTTPSTQPKSSPIKKRNAEKHETGQKKPSSTKKLQELKPSNKKVASTKQVDTNIVIESRKISPNKKPSRQEKKNLSSKKINSKEVNKISPDTNNNPKGRVLRARKVADVKSKVSPVKSNKIIKSPLKKNSPKITLQRPINKHISFKILEDNNKDNSNQDVYEFTYDPNEEPPPQKKKKRQPVKRKPAKPKTFVLKNNYEQNINKALASLKKTVAKKQGVCDDSNIPQSDQPLQAQKVIKVQKQEIGTLSQIDPDESQKQKIGTLPEIIVTSTDANNQGIPQIQRNVASKIIIGNMTPSQHNRNNVNNIQQKSPINIINNKSVAMSYSRITNQSLTKLPEPNKSIRVEDIAADFEPSFHDDLNYSPVYSPRPGTPIPQKKSMDINECDPLNLKDNTSFFNEQPVASSSINVSVRHPHASPWRVEFESLPIRWHVGSYVKPNMTPAVECSFVNFEDKNKKKHVYTNMVPQADDPLPEITEKSGPNLIQTSIISFVREVIERNSAKKRPRSATPATPKLFTEITNKTPEKTKNINTEKECKATRQLFTPKKNSDGKEVKDSEDTSSDKENSKESSKGQKRKNVDEIGAVPAKTPRNEKDVTFFGFDDSENEDLENVSPKKLFEGRKKSLRHRAKTVLKEINENKPTRAVVPLAAKTRNMEIERLYEEMKSASDAPVFPQKEPVDVGTANEPIEEVDEDSQSVHLYEDIEFLHHLKPHRKSYGKAKKVTFLNDDSDSGTLLSDPRPALDNSDNDNDLNDLTFDPAVPMLEERKSKKKITKKKQKMTKKEAEEAEAWAAGFNSMCEDVEGFDLIVE